MNKRSGIQAMAGAASLMIAGSAMATFHFWDIQEVYSNEDGTVQFIEWFTTFNSQHLLANKHVTTDANDFTFPANLSTSLTGNKRMLLATQGFADTPGAPTPDYIIPDNFFNIDGDTIVLRSTSTSTPQDSLSFGVGVLPTDDCHSINRALQEIENSPTNFSGVSGMVGDCSCLGNANNDDVVNVTDLVAVILDWGCMAGSCTGDVNNDNVVDVLDLLDVILGWGPC